MVTGIIIGLGNRGFDVYGHYTKVAPKEFKVVAVADIDSKKVEKAKREFSLKENQCYLSGEEILSQDQLAQVCIIATQDQDHVKQAVMALKKGYHVLCEKPISSKVEECLELQRVAHETKRIVAVGHVLRYTPFFSTIKKIIMSGAIGDVVTIQCMENVGYWHQAHSYVRGNWRDKKTSSPMILAKCCHDLDIFVWLLEDRCKRLSSYGNLFLFSEENQPAGATKRCLDGCQVKKECPYDCEKIYVTDPKIGVISQLKKEDYDKWPISVLCPGEITKEKVYSALEKGPYGRCVYACDNNVVDHQVVNMEFSHGQTVSFTMTAFTSKGGRDIHVCGTKGDLYGNLLDHRVILHPFGEEEQVISTKTGDMGGHAGGDNRLMHDFLDSVENSRPYESLRTGIDVSIESHIMALAAEYSREREGQSIRLDEFISGKLYKKVK